MITSHQHFDLYGKKVFEKATANPPFRFVYQMPDEACFYYLYKGKSRIYTPTSMVELDTAEGLALQCGNYLGTVLSGSGTEYCEAVAIHLPKEVLHTLYNRDFPDILESLEKTQPVFTEKHRNTELLKNYIDGLLFYFEHPQVVTEELLVLKLKELILLLARTGSGMQIRNLFRRLFSPNAHKLNEVVEAHLYHNLGLEDLAGLCNLSLSSFKRAFTKAYGCPPAGYIRQKRLEKAAQLLKVSELRISDIAFDCGFSDLSHFSKSFHKAYGVSPRQYRLG